MTRDAFICDAVRTPIGRYGGALSSVRTDDLAAHPIRALLERNPDLDPAAVEEVILGCANQAGEDNRNVARMAALLAGLPDSVPGATVNRLCASGLEAVVLAVPHEPYLELTPEKVVKMAGGPIAVVDCFGILSDDDIRRYFELGCEVKGLGRGHIQRIKAEVRGK